MDGMLQLSLAEDRIQDRERLAAATQARAALLASVRKRRRRARRVWAWLAGGWAVWHQR